MHRVLVVEDEQAIANLIAVSLGDEGYHCICAANGALAADILEHQSFDLILLDIMLPEVNGYELLEYIRPLKIPVIFLTAKGSLEERIKGLKLGAEDYIVKPFQIGELLARVEVVLRRYGKSQKILTFQDVSINTDAREVRKGGALVELTVKEYDLLLYLIRNKNIALYRDQIYEAVWCEPFSGETRTLDSHVQRLRRKLCWEDVIKTVFRIGYRLEVDE